MFIVKQVYWYISQISGERLQDHWSSGSYFCSKHRLWVHVRTASPNIDCGCTLEPPRRGGSNEYPQSMFWSKNKKNRNTPANPTFSYKYGFKGVYISRTCFPDDKIGVQCGLTVKINKMSRGIGKPTICIGENKGADQLRSNCEADQRHCFRYTDSTIPLLSKSKISSL